MIDFDVLLFRPAYGVFAQPAVLTIGSVIYEIEVIDGTRGVAVEEGGSIAVETIRPVVDVRRCQLDEKNIPVADMIDAELVLAGQTWRVKTLLELNYEELRLILIAEDTDVNAGAIHHRLTQTGGRRITETGEPRLLE